MTISMDKQYRTRDGREVRIYAVDGGGLQPVHGAIFDGEVWMQANWYARGTINPFSETSAKDLIEVKPRIRRERWVNVYETLVEFFPTKHSADCGAGKDRIACVKIVIDCEEGEGL